MVNLKNKYMLHIHVSILMKQAALNPLWVTRKWNCHVFSANSILKICTKFTSTNFSQISNNSQHSNIIRHNTFSLISEIDGV